MTYKILSHWTKAGLANEVNSFIKLGYVPVGNVSVSMTNTYATDRGTEYVQAVQKVEVTGADNAKLIEALDALRIAVRMSTWR